MDNRLQRKSERVEGHLRREHISFEESTKSGKRERRIR